MKDSFNSIFSLILNEVNGVLIWLMKNQSQESQIMTIGKNHLGGITKFFDLEAERRIIKILEGNEITFFSEERSKCAVSLNKKLHLFCYDVHTISE